MSTLTLCIINLDQVQHTVTLRHRFDRTGGTIGSDGADWVIKDPMAAFEALADAAPSTANPLQHLTAGERT
ncbi:hypothetical protein ABGT18_26865 [Pseudomonas putida]|jgi:predicted component of type VI protein secretion system|uniref:Uncharacterized protein n=2 Tax=Pseudomonas putida group TaxID=136845 RepID=A0A2N1IVP1_9PSED|nr:MULTISPECIES: hypothetical protein [Pseudomonas]MCO1619018.1 hypothetical protein [Pseudomonas putida]MDF3175486.1 hypothetical protein [Pseudomonas sp. ER28]MDH1933165.1 hypothetical protein [Pseudomonas sp. GD03696]MDX3744520.1 hypothetical protein [Pseudomonas sp.]MDY7070012.1 hypothetical protein [Pseudomonas hunanensis]